MIITRSGLLTRIRWFICISLARIDFGLCIYHLVVWSNFNLLHNSQWITFPTQSYLLLYSFFASLLHLLIMWLIISSLSPYNLHLPFYCILLTFALVCLILMVLFCTANGRYSVSFLRFLFLCHVLAFSSAILPICHLKYPCSCFSSHFSVVINISLFFIIIFTNSSARARYDTRSTFKRSLSGLNSEFSFS